MFVSYSLCLCYVHDFVKVLHGNVFPPPTKCVLNVQQENGSISCYSVLMSNAAVLGWGFWNLISNSVWCITL